MPSRNFLLIEDNEDDALLFEAVLLGMQPRPLVTRVQTEAEMRASLQARCWDLVLCDFSLPGFDAFKALSLLGKDGRGIPLIVVSGAIGEETAAELIKCGAHDYLNKNNLRLLPHAVERCLVDIDNRRQRQQAEEALRQSEARFRQVVENLSEVFWLYEPKDLQLVYLSPAFARIWGRSVEEMLLNQDLWELVVHPDDFQRIQPQRRERLLAGTYEESFRVLRPDGEQRWVRERSFLVRNDRGEAQLIVVVSEDITQQKSLEEQFLQAQRVEAMGTLAGGIAHDLNNILAPMLIGSNLLREDLQNSDQRELVRMIEVQAKRGAEIIRQLLTFSRRIEGRRSEVQVRHLVREMEAMAREVFPRSIEVVSDVEHELWTIIGDPTQLHQVLMNLFVNARDAMPSGGSLRVIARNRLLPAGDPALPHGAAPGAHVSIQVQDTGTGIPREILSRIFDPFFTTKPLGKGTGLGLSTVIGIVKSHGGWVNVESEPGKGSCFIIHLPASPGSEATESPVIGERAMPQGRGERILVVDDEPMICEAMRLTLEKACYRVDIAENGEAALGLFHGRSGEFDLVISDLMMPGLDGPGFLESLRASSARVPVIAMSGQDLDRTALLESLGIQQFIPKPVSVPALLLAVRQTLDGVTPASGAPQD